MIKTLITTLAPYKLAIIAGALALSHGTVFWKTWGWRDDVHDTEQRAARVEYETAKGATEKEAAEDREAVILERELVQRKLERATGELDSIKTQLGTVARCPAPRTLVERVFLHSGPAIRASTGDAATARVDPASRADPAGDDKQDATVDLRDLAWNYAVNVREVIEPNRADLAECIALYNVERAKYQRLNKSLD